MVWFWAGNSMLIKLSSKAVNANLEYLIAQIKAIFSAQRFEGGKINLGLLHKY